MKKSEQVKEILKILRESVPNAIGGLITAAVLVLIGAIYLSVWTTILTIAGIVWLVCVYLAFRRARPSRAQVRHGQHGAWNYPYLRPWALVCLLLIPLLVALSFTYQQYVKTQPPSKVIILVADFDGPKNYRVTDTILNRLHLALESYNDVEILTLGRAITETEGSATARLEGNSHKATIVIWGWYDVSGDVVPLSVHFEVLRPPHYLPQFGPEAQGVVQTSPTTELTSFKLQPKLSAEMAYLSLFTVGVVRASSGDDAGAIKPYTDALSQTIEVVPTLDRSVIYYFRGVSYAFKTPHDYDRAIADFNQAIQLQPNYRAAYIGRGNTYVYKADYDRAFADYNKAIELQPENIDAYRNRGNTYLKKRDYDHALADYNKAMELQPENPGAYLDRGNAYLLGGYTYHIPGDYDRSIEDYSHVLKLSSASAQDKASAYVSRSQVYLLKGDREKAVADLSAALESGLSDTDRQDVQKRLHELGVNN